MSSGLVTYESVWFKRVRVFGVKPAMSVKACQSSCLVQKYVGSILVRTRSKVQKFSKSQATRVRKSSRVTLLPVLKSIRKQRKCLEEWQRQDQQVWKSHERDISARQVRRARTTTARARTRTIFQ